MLSFIRPDYWVKHAKLLSSPMRQNWSFIFLKILIIFGHTQIVHRKLTVTKINDLGAYYVFVPTTAKLSRLFNRLYGRVSTIFKHQVLNGHLNDKTAVVIKQKMDFVYWPQNNNILSSFSLKFCARSFVQCSFCLPNGQTFKLPKFLWKFFYNVSLRLINVYM